MKPLDPINTVYDLVKALENYSPDAKVQAATIVIDGEEVGTVHLITVPDEGFPAR